MPNYMICKRCIMDTTDPDITFGPDGICNHCERHEAIARKRLFPTAERATRLAESVARIKKEGENRDYDCVIGVSGGVDSTYVAYLTRQLGLRPLAIHFDNGWNSELAVSNIEKTLRSLGIDLQTYVVDWPEFRDLQLAFLRASTPDGEVPTDHAIVALLYRTAIRLNIKTILLGVNAMSESIMPLKWGYGYSDLRYIKAVHRQYGTRALKSYPCYSLPQLYYYMKIRKIRMMPILDFIDYRKEVAMETIQSALGWVYYGGKHYESIYTRFFQAYILPRKFGIDKRKAHNSNLVLSGQLSRDDALTAMDAPVCDPDMLKDDRTYVIKKLGLKESEFQSIMDSPLKTFVDYPNSYSAIQLAKRFLA